MMYTYHASIVRVVDGDTIDCDVDLGFHLRARLRFRLLWYDAPEMTGPEKILGLQARDHLELLATGLEVMLRTAKGDSFGRWLCDVILPNGDDLVTELVADGWGVRWDGKGQRPQFGLTLPYPNKVVP